jgi:hypothetical protein
MLNAAGRESLFVYRVIVNSFARISLEACVYVKFQKGGFREVELQVMFLYSIVMPLECCVTSFFIRNS